MLKRPEDTTSATATKPLTVILLLAAALHAWGITHSLPYSYYGDEIHFVKRALSFGSGDLNPHWFHKPAFYMYLLFAEFGLLFVAGWILRAWGSVSEFAVQFIRDPYWFYLVGRVSTCAFSVLSVYLVYRIGARHFRKQVGLLAALFLTLSYAVVAAAQVVKADVPAMFFAVASLLFLLDYLDSQRLRDLILSTAAAGLGTATKVYPAMMLLPIAIAVVAAPWNRPAGLWAARGRLVRAFAIVALVYCGSYFVATPYSILDPRGREWNFGSVQQLTQASRQIAGGTAAEGAPAAVESKEQLRQPSPAKYVRTLLGYRGAGIVVGSIGLAGLLYAIGFGSLKLRLLLAFVLPFATASILTHTGLMAPRHQVAIHPFLALCGAAAFAALVDRLGRFRQAAFALLAIGLLLPVYSLGYRAVRISRPDTRNAAMAWIEQNIPDGTQIVIDENGPPLLPSRRTVLAGLEQAQAADPKGQFTAHYDTFLSYQLRAIEGRTTYDLTEIRNVWWSGSEGDDRRGVYTAESKRDREMGNPLKPVGVETYSYYVENEYRYAVVHSDSYERYMTDTAAAENRPALRDFYRELAQKAELVQEYSPSNGRFNGPVVRVYRFR